MFRGVQHINMDAKGRLAMPARQREPLVSQCEGRIVVTIDTQTSCLVIYPLPEWERIEGDIQGLPALNPAVKRFQRLMLGYATPGNRRGDGKPHPEQDQIGIRQLWPAADSGRSLQASGDTCRR